MFNNFIGGGQVFLHKVRMFQQVFSKTIHIAALLGIIAAVSINWIELQKLDWQAFYSYRKAVVADDFDEAMNTMRSSIGNKPNHITFVNAKTKAGVWAIQIDPRKVIRFYVFKEANRVGINLGQKILIWSIGITSLFFILIVVVWSKFGRNLKAEKSKDDGNRVLTAKEVKRKLREIGKMGDLVVGDMPLVKDSETKHFLVTGSTGSGKTNLIHNILLQVEKKKQPAIIIDQTGEMIAKYYDQGRGDIIFNPFDSRRKSWDFWSDCESKEELERFAKILFSFNRKKSGHSTDPFWEQSAESVFIACANYLRSIGDLRIEHLCSLTRDASLKSLQNKLRNTEASRYLEPDNKTTASSILSVLATSTKPLSYLRNNTSNATNVDDTEFVNVKNSGVTSQDSCIATTSFSLKEHFKQIDQGASNWLFLATKPSARELTMPLIACLSDLAFSRVVDIGIKEDRRIWFVIDELSSLGKLPALSTIMSEGRKYGACVLSGLQSLNQLYSHYGQYEGSTIFGQFGTNFFFRNKEPAVAKMVSSICGIETIYRQQKNTSFGAHEFRDGVSYSEQKQQKDLVEYSDLASLGVGECIALLPEPKVRITRLQTPVVNLRDKNPGFIQAEGITTTTYNEVENMVMEHDQEQDDIDNDAKVKMQSEDKTQEKQQDSKQSGAKTVIIDSNKQNQEKELEYGPDKKSEHKKALESKDYQF